MTGKLRVTLPTWLWPNFHWQFEQFCMERDLSDLESLTSENIKDGVSVMTWDCPALTPADVLAFLARPPVASMKELWVLAEDLIP